MKIDIKIMMISILFAVLGGGFLLYSKNEGVQKASETMGEQDNEGHIWTCSMHPQIRKDGPGKCPICSMDLVKAETLGKVKDQSQSHVPEAHVAFTLSNNRIQMIGVKYGTVGQKVLFKSIEAAGKVAFDPELYTAQNEFIEAVRQQERVKDAPIADVKHSALRMVESAKLRLKVLGLSDQQISKLRSSGGPTTGSNLLITSPGEDVWIYAEVFEMDLSNVDAGQQVKISGGALEGKELFGKVASVDRVINPVTRTAKVRILVPNSKAQLRPEAFVDVTILSPLGEQVVVPFDAILDSGKEAWVFVVKDNGHFVPRTVVIKYYVDDEVAIGSGLEPGEKIVTSANFLLDSESRLKGALASEADALGVGEEGREKTGPKVPECPKGQEWNEAMKHCMPKVGG